MQKEVKYLLMACLVTAACDTAGWDYPLEKSRSQVLVPNAPAHYVPDTAIVHDPEAGDTVLYLCGVRTPDGYDWQRDTGIGIARGEVVLFRNMKEVFAIPTGYNECVSTDPDTHHLIDGNLFTEFSSSSDTFIKKNGKTVLFFSGREYLAGMIDRYDGIYTLGMLRSGDGLCLRKNGETQLEVKGGIACGSFADSSYPQTGALYEDSGDIWFAYNVDAGGGRLSHIVKNGVDVTVAGGPYDDIKVIDGRILAVRKSSEMGVDYFNGRTIRQIGTAYLWKDCSLFNADGKVWVVGAVQNRYGRNELFVALDADKGSVSIFPAGDYHLYRDNDKVGLAPAAYPGFHYFSRMCMDYLDGRLYVALSPGGDGSKPILRVNGKDTELKMTGYLSGVQVWLNPPS